MMIDATASPRSGESFGRRRRRRRRRQNPVIDPLGGVVNNNSFFGPIVWAILLIGLIFCLADVAYILRYIDTTHTINNGNIQHNILSHIKKENNAVMQGKFGGIGASFGGIGVLNAKPGFVDESGLLSNREFRFLNKALHEHDMEVNGNNENFKYVPPEPGLPLTDKEWDDIKEEKLPILEMLQQAFDMSNLEELRVGDRKVDSTSLRDLPTWNQVTALYGNVPKIYGLDQCQAFQDHSDKAEHFVGVAGTFNSGTNLMAEYLISNCRMESHMAKYGATSRGVRWQVPWGKHNPPGDEEFRNSHKTKKDSNVDAKNILPAVTVRDPYVWMNSMCAHEYAAHWHHDPHGHCPNLIPDDADLKEYSEWLKEDQPIGVHLNYGGRLYSLWKHHTSLVGMWNDWYREYWDTKAFSRIIVRYEDLLFHPQEVTKAVCECAGGTMFKPKFEFVLNSAKKGPTAHGPMELRVGYLKALVKYGQRKTNPKLTPKDLAYAKDHLDAEMMDFLHYKHPHEVEKH